MHSKMPSRFGSPKMPMKRVCLKHQHTLNFSIRTTDHSTNNNAWVKKHLKHFKMVLAGHLTDTLPGKGSKILLHHQDCPVHILSLHPLCICLDCLHPYLCFFWKEDKNLDDTNTLLPTFNMITHMWIWNQYHVTVVLLLRGLSCPHFLKNDLGQFNITVKLSLLAYSRH